MRAQPHDPAQALLRERRALHGLATALLRDPDAADEVVQDALLAALDADKQKVTARLPWLRSAVRNLAWKRIDRERNRRWREREQARSRPEASVPLPESQLARLEMHDELHTALRELKEPYRSTLSLRFFEDLSPAQIARKQGIAPGTVRWRLKAGLDALRDALDQRHNGDRAAWMSALAPLLQLDSGARTAGSTTSLIEGYRNMSLAAQLSVLSIPVALGATAFTLRSNEPPAAAALAVETKRAVLAPVQTEASAAVKATLTAPGRQERQPVDAPSSGLISEALDAYAREQIHAGWRKELGSDPEPEQLEAMVEEFVALVKKSPGDIGRRGGSDYAERTAAAQIGGPLFEILTALDQGREDERAAWVLDGKRFAKEFERGRGPSLDGTQHLDYASEALVDGTTVTLPPGVFRMDDFMGDQFPRDVTLVGAGMNTTLVYIEELASRGPVVNLGFKDLTLHTDNDYLFDLRLEPASVRMDHVRVIGFDKGAGSSCAFGTQELALLARDSVFEGGYGQHPEDGRLLDIRTPGLLARFERCRFDLIELPFHWVRSGAQMVFDNCQITRELTFSGAETAKATLARNQGIRLVATPIDYFYPPDLSQGRPVVPKKDLGELFPDWKEPIER